MDLEQDLVSLISLAIITAIAALIIQESDLDQEDTQMVPTAVETRLHLIQVTCKPRVTFLSFSATFVSGTGHHLTL